MEHFDINKIIEHYKPNIEDLAKVLFPNVKYPNLAFGRILKGEADLDIVQIERLAEYLGILTTDLFSVNSWKGISENGLIILLKDKYKVKLNYNDIYLSIYKDDKLICQKISNIPSMTVRDFINYLNNEIKNYEDGNI